MSVCQVKQINDSRLVGMSIYNVAILCIITAPVTLVIADQQNATFAFVALANVFCCYLSMALVFVPKVFYLLLSESIPSTAYFVQDNEIPFYLRVLCQVVFIIQHPGHDPREREDEDEKKKQEQEAKLKKLLKENEELQKDIAEKDRRIDLLRKHIAAKREAAEREARSSQEAEQARTSEAGAASNGNGVCRWGTLDIIST